MYSDGSVVVASAVSPALQRAYLNAEYRVLTEPSFRFRMGRPCPELAQLVRNRVPPHAFFITAYNPYSEPRPDEVNQRAHRSLAAELERRGLTMWEAEGLDPVGDWPPEPGFVIAGLTPEAARALGNQFDQNAIVRIDSHGRATLLLLR